MFAVLNVCVIAVGFSLRNNGHFSRLRGQSFTRACFWPNWFKSYSEDVDSISDVCRM